MTPSETDATTRLLTDAELELMTILWRIEGGTVREVMDCLPEGRDLAYTSVSTILRILEQKGFVQSEKLARSHRYMPVIDKPRYQQRNLRHLVGGLFNGDPLALVRRLISADSMTEDDLRDLRSLVEERLKE